MNNLLRAELLKARATRATRVLVLIAPAFCALWAVAIVVFSPSDSLRLSDVYTMAQQGYVFAMIVGVMGMAGEYRHQTITWAFLVTPRRGAVVAAKLAAYGLIGLLVAILSALATLAVGAAALALAGHQVLSWDVPLILVGAMLSTALYAVFGVALAVLIKNQPAAIIVACLVFSYGDNFLGWLVPGVYPWLPTGAARALGGMHLNGGTLLPAWGGGLLFVAYTAAIVLVARVLTLRRDVT
jgi:ABC-2 type transport system permease protein